MPATPAADRPGLQPAAFAPLPLGSVRPLGWLKAQCRLQADTITGRIEEFWPDLGPGNMWLGGGVEGWERGPYYLDGLTPLAHVLDDPRLKAKAQRWIDSILGMVRPDGWIGPVQAPDRQAYDHWPVFLVLKVLVQHAEATGDPRVVPAVTGFCRWLRDNLAAVPLRDWGKHRWADGVLSIHWLYQRTGEAWLLDVAAQLAEQGYDWRAHFADFVHTAKTPREACVLHTHVVNNAMAVKTAGVWWRQSGDPADAAGPRQALEALDTWHGQATGIFTGDEHYAGVDPTQGTELCAVAEMMYSLEELLPILGAPELADRLERIAYNALPGAFTEDMWGHQYDQQANQALCTVAPRHWTNNDDTSNTFGLEPNYGCCTANLHQGWPKLVRSLWMQAPDGGLVSAVLGPSVVRAQAGGAEVVIEERTGYPFEMDATYHVVSGAPEPFGLTVRVPGWCEGAELTSPDGSEELEPGWHTVRRVWSAGDELHLHLPMRARCERRYRGAAALHYGPLVLSLQVPAEYRIIAGHPDPEPGQRSADYELLPAGEWAYTLELGSDETPHVAIERREVRDDVSPFTETGSPLRACVFARRVPEWGLVMNSAGPTPESPCAGSGEKELVTLVPYGATRLRMTELPTVSAPG